MSGRNRVDGALRVQALRLIRGGMSVNRAAQTVGVHRFTVRTWCDAAGVARPGIKRVGNPVISEGVARVAAGESFYRVAVSLGVHRTVVRGWCSARGVRSSHVADGRPRLSKLEARARSLAYYRTYNAARRKVA